MRIQPPRLAKQTEANREPKKKITIKLRLKPKVPVAPRPIIGNARVTKCASKRNIAFAAVDEVRDFYEAEAPWNVRVVPEVATALNVIREAGLSLQDSQAIMDLKEKLNVEKATRRLVQTELGAVKKQLGNAQRSLAKTIPLHRFEALQEELHKRPSRTVHEALLNDHFALSAQSESMQDTLRNYEHTFADLKADCEALRGQVATLQAQRPALPPTPAEDTCEFANDPSSFFDDALDARLFEMLNNHLEEKAT